MSVGEPFSLASRMASLISSVRPSWYRTVALTAAQHNYDLKVQPSSVTLTQDLQAISNAGQALRSAQVNAAKASQGATNQIDQAKQGVAAAQHGYQTKVAPVATSQIATDQAAVASADSAVVTAKKFEEDRSVPSGL